jgi:hypothetical protein
MMMLDRMNTPRWIVVTWVLISLTASFPYLFGRLMLLVLPFTSLRSLPTEAY